MSKGDRIFAMTGKFLLLAASLTLSAPAFGNMVINLVAGPELASNTAALDAFQRAAVTWESLFADPITVTIDANLANLGSSTIIGQTNSTILGGSYTTVRNQLVQDASQDLNRILDSSLPTSAEFQATVPAGYTLSGNMALTKADAKAMGFQGLDQALGASDGSITFNDQFAFDYDSGDGVASNEVDFQSVATHEIGHLLGFTSSVDDIDLALHNQDTTFSIDPTPLDLFRFDAGDVPTTAAAFTSALRDLVPGSASVLSDTNVQYSLSTGFYNGDGRQASHWKDDVLTGNYIGIMDPTLADGLAETVTAADVRAMELIGYDPVPEPATWGLAGGALLVLIAWRWRAHRASLES
ncbi:MAG TPA: NF038122 family metalloprotease [Bryobacteraceae bacterium]|nr:NF038122 family metalloprotease [Bryobacteraceae bacterium]